MLRRTKTLKSVKLHKTIQNLVYSCIIALFKSPGLKFYNEYYTVYFIEYTSTFFAQYDSFLLFIYSIPYCLLKMLP